MPDNLFPPDPNDSNTPEDLPTAQEAGSNNPPPAGSPPDGSTVQGRGALSMLSINIEEEMRRSYLDYSMSVIIGRALPDVRDGLKPVHRRILYGMQEMGLQYNKKYTKSAKVVGHVMGNYHPHGDSAIYDTMVRLAQPFSLRYLMVDGQGNFGSVDGDPPAAMRLYRVPPHAHRRRDARRYRHGHRRLHLPTTTSPPSSPPSCPPASPTLSSTGSSGIAVGMATNIPPHNLTETLNAAIAILTKSTDEKNAHRADLDIALDHVLGPDFPTGGVIFGRTQIPNAYRTGRGRFIVRSRTSIEKDLRRPRGHHRQRDPLSGQQNQAHGAHRRARQRRHHHRHRP